MDLLVDYPHREEEISRRCNKHFASTLCFCVGVLYAFVAYLHLCVQRHVLEPLSVGLAVPCLRALGRGGLMVPEGNDPLATLSHPCHLSRCPSSCRLCITSPRYGVCLSLLAFAG